MKVTRDFNVSVSYPLIRKDNAQDIQTYYENNLCPIKSDGTYLNYFYALKDFCEEINQPGVPPFSLWKSSTADAYISQINCNYQKAVYVVKVVKNLLYSAGSTESFEALKAAHYGNKYRISFYTFGEMDTMIRRAYDATHQVIEWDTLNDWSTSVVICYLLWLGFSKAEISMLQKSDYDERTGTIVLETCGKNQHSEIVKRRAIDEPGIEDYLHRYIRGNQYYLYDDYHGRRPYDYIYSTSLIKSVIRESAAVKDIVDNCCKRYSAFFGFTSDDVLTAGRMNRLYYYDVVKSVEINEGNIERIADCLGLEKPTKVFRNGELGNLIALYPSYKSERINHK